jgi:hypothetical protein
MGDGVGMRLGEVDGGGTANSGELPRAKHGMKTRTRDTSGLLTLR